MVIRSHRLLSLLFSLCLLILFLPWYLNVQLLLQHFTILLHLIYFKEQLGVKECDLFVFAFKFINFFFVFLIIARAIVSVFLFLGLQVTVSQFIFLVNWKTLLNVKSIVSQKETVEASAFDLYRLTVEKRDLFDDCLLTFLLSVNLAILVVAPAVQEFSISGDSKCEVSSA